jgi:hypothetical protein
MVEGVKAGSVGGAAPPERDGIRTGSGQFSMDDAVGPLSRTARLSSMPAIGLESMLALQSVDEAVERDRLARKRGTAIIAALTKLQRTILAEVDPSQALNALNELTSDNPAAADPGLGAILRAVVLRSRIEIARRVRRGDARDNH